LSAISETSDLIPRANRRSRIAFAKIEDEEIQKQIDKLEATKVANKAENKIVEPEKKRFSLMIF
jgi:methionyl-tRNA synthetase